MIITMGILLVMTVGLIYDTDCRSLTACQRRLEWACEEALFAAAVSADREDEEEAEAAAWEVLQKNLQVDGNGMPLEKDGPFEGPLRWKLTLSERWIRLEVNCGFFRSKLPFLQKTAEICTQEEHFRKQKT